MLMPSPDESTRVRSRRRRLCGNGDYGRACVDQQRLRDVMLQLGHANDEQAIL
jgi:hypothetical protein